MTAPKNISWVHAPVMLALSLLLISGAAELAQADGRKPFAASAQVEVSAQVVGRCSLTHEQLVIAEKTGNFDSVSCSGTKPVGVTTHPEMFVTETGDEISVTVATVFF